MLVIPKVKKMPAGFRPTIETYPIINGINVPQSPKAPPNSRKVNFLIFNLGSSSLVVSSESKISRKEKFSKSN